MSLSGINGPKKTGWGKLGREIVPNRLRMVALAAAVCLAALLVALLPCSAQYPGQVTDQNKNTPAIRAVGVLEWTGDIAHPKASRLVPITVFDGQQLQDGSIYLARPQPLALDGEVEYELEKDGKTVGFYDIHSAAEQQGYWIGFGNWKPLPVGPTPAELARRRQMAKVDVDNGDNGQPILHRKHHPGDTDSSGSSQASAPDPDRPTLHKAGDAAGDAGSDTASDNSSAPQPDLDRPVLHQSSDDSNSDGDRPKLQKKQGEDVASVASLPDISDPDRPRLKRGQPVGYGAAVTPTLMGLPPQMEQEVAVSDARPIKDHPWDFSWADAADEIKMKSVMEDIARKELGLETLVAQPAAAPNSGRAAARRTSVRKKTATPTPAPLVDEKFRVFELAYGAGATMVLSAHTAGTGSQQKFVTLIAQPDLYGSVVVLMKNVTDGAHLDETPRMNLIDAVDANGDNRGELLFELRGQSQRQFALYLVYRGQVTQLFDSSPEYFGSTQSE